jgi:hypothetical protein
MYGAPIGGKDMYVHFLEERGLRVGIILQKAVGATPAVVYIDIEKICMSSCS